MIYIIDHQDSFTHNVVHQFENFDEVVCTNFNKIDDAYLQLTLNKIVNYQQPMLVKAYGVHLNIFRVINGLSSLVFI